MIVRRLSSSTSDGQLATDGRAAERAKEQSPVVSDFDASADRNGYSRTLLEAMVVVEKSVHWVQAPKTGERKFVDEAEYQTLTKAGWTPVPNVPDPIDGPTSLLTLQTDEAVKIGLAKEVAISPAALASSRHLNIVADFTPSAGDKIVELLAKGAVRGLLLSIFLTSVYISLSAPGTARPRRRPSAAWGCSSVCRC